MFEMMEVNGCMEFELVLLIINKIQEYTEQKI